MGLYLEKVNVEPDDQLGEMIDGLGRSRRARKRRRHRRAKKRRIAAMRAAGVSQARLHAIFAAKRAKRHKRRRKRKKKITKIIKTIAAAGAVVLAAPLAIKGAKALVSGTKTLFGAKKLVGAATAVEKLVPLKKEKAPEVADFGPYDFPFGPEIAEPETGMIVPAYQEAAITAPGPEIIFTERAFNETRLFG